MEIVTVGGLGTVGDVSVWRVVGGALSRVGQYPIPNSELEDVGIENLDGDPLLEIVVTGRSTAAAQALLEVLSWDGAGWTQKAAVTFDPGYGTTAWAVAIGELDGLPPLEIVTAGSRGPGLSNGHVAAWHFSAGTLTKIAEYFVAGGTTEGVVFWDVAIGDPDNDLLPEILAVGSEDLTGANPYSQLRSYRLDVPWTLSPDSSERRPGEVWLSVAIGDVDMDGEIESIVAGQEVVPGVNRWGALAVVKARAPPMGDFVHELDRYRWLSWTWPWSTVIGDPDGDMVYEFLTGAQRSPVDNAAELRAWNWNIPPKPDDSWPQFHRDASHIGVSGATAPTVARVEWYQYYLSGGEYKHDRYSPIVYDGKVFVVVLGNMYAYTVAGSDVWGPVTVPDTILGPWARSLAAGNGRVYYGGTAGLAPPNGVLSAYQSSDGALLWTKGIETFPDQMLQAPPTVAGDLVLAGTLGGQLASPPGRLYAFDQAGGQVWTFSPGSDVTASAAVSGTRAYVRAGTDLYSIPLSDPDGNGALANPSEIDWRLDMGLGEVPATASGSRGRRPHPGTSSTWGATTDSCTRFQRWTRRSGTRG